MDREYLQKELEKRKLEKAKIRESKTLYRRRTRPCK